MKPKVVSYFHKQQIKELQLDTTHVKLSIAMLQKKNRRIYDEKICWINNIFFKVTLFKKNHSL